MEILERKTYERLPVERDLIPIPEDVPMLGIKAGDEGLVRSLSLRNGDELVALVGVSYSTGQPRGWIEVNVVPETKVLSHSTIG